MKIEGKEEDDEDDETISARRRFWRQSDKLQHNRKNIERKHETVE